jgi:hypothetical protein
VGYVPVIFVRCGLTELQLGIVLTDRLVGKRDASQAAILEHVHHVRQFGRKIG